MRGTSNMKTELYGRLTYLWGLAPLWACWSSDGKLTAYIKNDTSHGAKAIFETLILSRMDTMRAVRQEMNFDGL